MDPMVTFVVPCYNLAHLLEECVNSILSQTYKDFEILIMDDSSPDNTPEVAQSFKDPRVIYVRNEANLRHLANYNKGINLARGKYIWLISADDYLHTPYVLEKYVIAMENYPDCGYVFCPAIRLIDNKESGIVGYSPHDAKDIVFNGQVFIKTLLEGNSVVAASAMARKECYTKVSFFPLDMPFAGDWYLWCLFALYYNVAYFSEPMVVRRDHNLMMTNILKKKDIEILFRDDIKVITRIRDRACQDGKHMITYYCDDNIINTFANWHGSYKLNNIEFSVDEFESLLGIYTSRQMNHKQICARIFSRIADQYYWNNKVADARCYYAHAMRKDLHQNQILLKYLLSFLGDTGASIRKFISTARKHMN